MNYLIPFAFITILACLAFALYFMLRGGRDGKGRGMARALALRVSFSIALFLCILLGWKLGWIHPTGIQISK